jgi:hypothetical protein
VPNSYSPLAPQPYYGTGSSSSGGPGPSPFYGGGTSSSPGPPPQPPATPAQPITTPTIMFQANIQQETGEEFKILRIITEDLNNRKAEKLKI